MGRKVGIIRDERYLLHKPGNIHPEHPRRLTAIYRMLDANFSSGLIELEPDLVTLEHLEFVHTPSYIHKVLKTADHNYTSLAPDTPASSKTYLSAWLAVGGCLKGLDALFSNQCDVCFSFVRPPGHHALPNRAGGFCVFNNLGIAARYALKRHGLKRIMIIDWDIHHGNGLNDIFYGEKEVLYLSTHDPMLYPYTGGWNETGRGSGEGFTVNIPIPRELDDQGIISLYEQVAGPAVMRYQPELILVDAGFDAHHQDPIGRAQLTEEAFRGLTQLILYLGREVDHPPILFALEGGYDTRALAASVKAVLQVLTSEVPSRKPRCEETPRAAELVKKAWQAHNKYGIWVD